MHSSFSVACLTHCRTLKGPLPPLPCPTLSRRGPLATVRHLRRTDLTVRMSRAVVLMRSSLGQSLLELDARDTTFCYQNEVGVGVG